MTVVLDTLGAQQGVQTDGLWDKVKSAGSAITKAAGHTTPNYDSIYKKIEKWEMAGRSDQEQIDLFNTKKEACKTKMDEALTAFTDMVDFMKTYKEKHNTKEKDIPSISL